jgi:hypothetical protein
MPGATSIKCFEVDPRVKRSVSQLPRLLLATKVIESPLETPVAAIEFLR